MLEVICQKTNAFIDQMPKEQRKSYGQFFTSLETAQFMASLFTLPSEENISVLDAGAGSGILSIAAIEHLFSKKKDIKVHLTCYENDPNIIPLLKSNLETAQEHFPNLTFRILNENYITSQENAFKGCLFEAETPSQYDLIIGNPPYKKISKDAPEALAMPAVCHGAPNLYFLFAAMGIFNLKDGGELVYITPRSWTSGAYFEKFRLFLIEQTSLERIHLFESRTDVFDKESVLQETMIFKLKKRTSRPAKTCISTTNGNKDFLQIKKIKTDYATVVSPFTHYIYLPANEQDLQTLNKIKMFENTLPSLGLKMKTGIVVDFKFPEMLESTPSESNVPLFYSKHIKNGKVLFPVGIENEYVKKDRKGFLQPNRNYLFVKRFTSKEENRRFQAGIYLRKDYPNFELISTQNKINFIDGDKEMNEQTVHGLYVIFNSSLYDSYYRILNGSTQVNSTEVNTMPIPSLKVIQDIGKKLIKSKDFSEENCNHILNEVCHE